MTIDISKRWVKETPERRINHGDPDTITQCPSCRVFYRNGQRVEKPVQSWFRIVIGNWWRYGWRITVDFGSIHPIGYGVSWQEENRLAMVMHPIPFNVVMRTLREFVLWMHRGGWRQFPSKQDEIDCAVAKRLQFLNRK